MNKFKVGDKVRYIEPTCGRIKQGQVYTVSGFKQTLGADAGIHLAEFPMEDHWDPFWYEFRFELVQPVVRYFINPTGFKDETSYVVLTEDTFTTIRSSGEVGRSFQIDETYERIIGEGGWKEVSQEEAEATLQAVLKEWLVEDTVKKASFLFWSTSDPSYSYFRAVFTGNTRTVSKRGVPCV